MSDTPKSNQTVDMSENPADEHPNESPKKDLFIVRQATGRTRFIATVPATGLLIASVVMAIGTFIQVIVASYEFIIGEINVHGLAIEYVEGADLFLLAVALYILSIGLVRLFISERIALPKWLEFHDFDDLKERLTGVIIVMIGVYFLGYVLKGARGIDTLWIGLACAAVIIALAFFLHSVFKSGE